MHGKQLKELAQLIKRRNQVDQEIASIIDYPALIGHVGEFIASTIFGIALETSASHKSYDGKFTRGAMAGKTVNIKWSAKRDGLVNLTPDDLPDYYLVMTGPKTGAVSSRGTSQPWCITSVFLFNAHQLVTTLRERGVKIGVATSVIARLWDEAEIYPTSRNPEFILSTEQRLLLALFDTLQVVSESDAE